MLSFSQNFSRFLQILMMAAALAVILVSNWAKMSSRSFHSLFLACYFRRHYLMRLMKYVEERHDWQSFEVFFSRWIISTIYFAVTESGHAAAGLRHTIQYFRDILAWNAGTSQPLSPLILKDMPLFVIIYMRYFLSSASRISTITRRFLIPRA